jgi:hypothetical protein
MLIYYHGSPDKLPVAEHTIIVAPAGHLPKGECLSEWWDTTGERPKPFEYKVQFFFGQAEVDDQLGKYMIAAGLASSTRLIVPNAWDR